MIAKYDYLFKLILIGDSSVGKSSILSRFADNKFTESNISTIGVDFSVKTLEIENKIVKLQIWDTSGQCRFKSITQSYYRGAHGVVLVYDVSKPDSFQSLVQWLDNIEKHCVTKVNILIVGNKVDLGRKVSQTDAMSFTLHHSAMHVETSAKLNLNIEKAFVNIARSIRKRIDMQIEDLDNENNDIIRIGTSKKMRLSSSCRKC